MPRMENLIFDVPTDTQVKGIALAWAEGMIAASLADLLYIANDRGQGRPPPINLLSFGYLRWSDVWSDIAYNDNNPSAEFSRLRTFAVDYCKTSLADFAPVLTQLTLGPTYDIPGKYDNISVLQPYWLS